MWVRYRGDADRKRVEGVVERYRDKLRFTRAGGVVYFVEAGDPGVARAFVEELYRKLGGVVRVYRLSDLEFKPSPRRLVFKYGFSVSSERLWGYIEAFMASHRGVLVSEIAGTRRYSVYIRSEGEVDTRINVFDKNGGSIAVFELEGYSRAVDTFYKRLSEYLESLGGVEVK